MTAQLSAPVRVSPLPELVFDRLFRQHQQGLYRFVYRQTGHAEDAMDIVQQTFAEAWCSQAVFRGDSLPSTWLYGIGQNLVRQYLAKSRRFSPGDDEPDHLVSQVTPADHLLATQRELALVVQSLSTLPDAVCEALLLVVWDNLSYDEAARRLGLPVGTLRSQLSRARTRIRKQLDNAC